MGIDPVTLGIAAIAIGGLTAASAASSRQQEKSADSRSKDQERLQKQLRDEAAAAPGIAEEKARKETLRRRKTIALRGQTILTGEGPEASGGKTVLGG